MSKTMNSESPAHMAVVGVGRIGRQHAAAIQRSPRLVLAGVADPSDRARASLNGEAVVLKSGVDPLLADVPIEAAVVAVPSGQHVEVVSKLLHAGVPVLCEKPAGLRSDQVKQLGALATELNVPLLVGYWRRFAPALAALRERIRSGSLGEISMVIAVQWDGEPPPPAFRDPASSGGILVDMGVHEFDMLRWLTGQDVEAVAGFASEVNWAEPVAGDPETVNLVARMSGGATAVITLARRHAPGDLCRVEVLGGEEAVALTYLEPTDGQSMMLDALQAQAEALAVVARGGDSIGADIADATAALVAAEQAAAAIAERLTEIEEVSR